MELSSSLHGVRVHGVQSVEGHSRRVSDLHNEDALLTVDLRLDIVENVILEYKRDEDLGHSEAHRGRDVVRNHWIPINGILNRKLSTHAHRKWATGVQVLSTVESQEAVTKFAPVVSSERFDDNPVDESRGTTSSLLSGNGS